MSNQSKLKLKKRAARQFRRLDDKEELLVPAEYEIHRNGACIALLVKAQDGWRVCKPTDDSLIGVAVSPVDLNKFREVRQWALEHLRGGGRRMRDLILISVFLVVVRAARRQA